MNMDIVKYCPLHGYPLPCHKCGYGEREDVLLLTLAAQGCKMVNPDNPVRVAVSISSLHDLLKAVEKYLHDFDEVMIGAGKAKKEGVLHPTDLVGKISNLQSELKMWATLARSHIGETN